MSVALSHACPTCKIIIVLDESLLLRMRSLSERVTSTLPRASVRSHVDRARVQCSQRQLCLHKGTFLFCLLHVPCHSRGFSSPMAAPGAGAPIPAAASLPPPATPHNFIRVVVVGEDNTLDYLATPKAAKLIAAFPNLGWVDSSTAMAGTSSAPALAIAAVTCPAVNGVWGDATCAPMEAMSELTACFTPAACSRCADAEASLGLLDRVYLHTQDFYDALELLLSAQPSVLPTPSPFDFAAGDLEVRSPFLTGGTAATPAVPATVAVPAVAAVAGVPARPAQPARPARRAGGGNRALPAIPAVPAARAVRAVAAVPAVLATPAMPAAPAVPPSGPPALLWWYLVAVGHGIDQAGVLPFLGFCRRGLLARDRCSAAARDDETSIVRAVSLTLLSFVAGVSPFVGRDGAAGHAVPSDTVLARHFRRFQTRLLALPDELRSGSFDADVLEVELMDDVAYGSGLEAKQQAVTIARLPFIRRAYPNVFDYLSRVGSSAARVTTLEKVSGLLPKKGAEQPLFHRLADLELYFQEHSAFLVQCWNKGLPIEGADGVTSLLLKERDEWAESSSTKVSAPDAGDALLGSSVSGTTLTERALRRALVEDSNFVTSADDILLLDVDVVEDRESAVEMACLANCYVYQRFFSRPAPLLHRHPVFTALHRCIGALPVYFGRAQAAGKATCIIDPLVAEWT